MAGVGKGFLCCLQMGVEDQRTALRSSHGVEREEDGVDDALRGQDVAGAAGDARAWPEQGLLLHDDFNGPDGALVQRDLSSNHASDGV